MKVEKGMHVLFGLDLLIFVAANAKLIMKPSDQKVPLGIDAQFLCMSNISDKSIEWLKIENQFGKMLPPLVVFDGNEVEHNLVSRYIVTQHDGVSTLKIASVTRTDFGTYKCTDDDGFGDKATAALGFAPHLPTTLRSTTIEYEEQEPVVEEIRGDEGNVSFDSLHVCCYTG